MYTGAKVVQNIPLMCKVDRRSSESIYNSLRGHTLHVSAEVDSQFAHKNWIGGTLSAGEIGCYACNERHPLLLKCLILCLRCYKKTRGASDST